MGSNSTTWPTLLLLLLPLPTFLWRSRLSPIRVAQANTSPTDAVNTEPTVLKIALPPLRTAAARSNGNDEPAPLPTLRAARVLTPEPLEAEDETSLVLRDDRTKITLHDDLS
jgi:hypothetical protein